MTNKQTLMKELDETVKPQPNKTITTCVDELIYMRDGNDNMRL